MNPPWGSSPFPSLPRENIQVVRHSVFWGGSAERKGLGHRKFYRNVSSSPISDPALLWNLQIPQKGWQGQSVPPVRGVSWGAVSSGVRWEKHKPRRPPDLSLSPSSGTFLFHLGQVTSPIECKLQKQRTWVCFVYYLQATFSM